ncbi:MAG TPA: serine/threonine-protein kinase [Thermoanaerobaculia bacterium]|jgi:tetratricopeptide (TPR) repeat protein|nr:serine/threonine-protein kinase [Thermoanaerobaculia bacterium]
MDLATHPPVAGGQPVALQGGQVLAGRYRVTAFLGSGSVGEVYEAEDLELGGRIALKILHPGADDEPVLRRFKQEIQLARRVTHPNVCRTYDLAYHCEEAEMSADSPPRLRVFLTMELLRGETLADRLASQGRMAPGDALPVARQVAAALTAAHAAGVVHRDLKSGNIFLVTSLPASPAETRAVVTDFGLAGSSGEAASETGELMGSPAYMAPEQVRGEAATPATDIYAFGVVLYEMVTGELPFMGPSAFYTAVKRLKEPPPPPRDKVPALDPAWNAAILRCLEREPANRFATADEVLGALSPASPPQPAQTLRSWGRAAACLLFLTIGVFALLVPRMPVRQAEASRPELVAARLEQWNHLAEVLARERERGDTVAEAKTQGELASLTRLRGDLPAALRGYRRVAALRRAAGDRRGLAEALQNMAAISYDLGDPEGARSAWEESLALSRRAGDRAGIAVSLHGLAGIDRLVGDLAAAQTKYEQAFTLYRALRQPLQQASMLHETGRLYELRRQPERALQIFARALDICGEAGPCPLQAAVLNDIGRVHGMLGDPLTSRANYQRSLELSRAAHDKTEEARALVGLGETALDLGDPRAAQAFFQDALAIFHLLGNRNRETDAISGMARCLAAAGNYQGALSKYEESRAVRLELGERLFANDNLLAIAELALDFHHPAEAAAAAREAVRVFRELGVPESEAKAASILARCRTAGRISS